jgi:hypothetical protein
MQDQLAELSCDEICTWFSSAIRLKAEFSLPDPPTSEIGPKQHLW